MNHGSQPLKYSNAEVVATCYSSSCVSQLFSIAWGVKGTCIHTFVSNGDVGKSFLVISMLLDVCAIW